MIKGLVIVGLLFVATQEVQAARRNCSRGSCQVQKELKAPIQKKSRKGFFSRLRTRRAD